jgi:hypothetical protein
MSKDSYKITGVTTGKDGVTRVAYANDMKRAAVLKYNGHTNIKLVPMMSGDEELSGDRTECLNFLLSHPEFKEIPCVIETAKELGFKV